MKDANIYQQDVTESYLQRCQIHLCKLVRYKERIHNKVDFCAISVFVLIIHEDAELPEKPVMF